MPVWPFGRKARRRANTLSTSSDLVSHGTSDADKTAPSSRPRTPRNRAVGESEVLQHHDTPPKGTAQRKLNKRRSQQRKRASERNSGGSGGGVTTHFISRVENDIDKADPGPEMSRSYVSSPGAASPVKSLTNLDPSDPEAHPSHYLRDEHPTTSASLTTASPTNVTAARTGRANTPSPPLNPIHKTSQMPRGTHNAAHRRSSSSESITALPASVPLRTSPHLRPATHSSTASSIIPYNFHLSRSHTNPHRSRSGTANADTSADEYVLPDRSESQPHLSRSNSRRDDARSSSLLPRRRSTKPKQKKPRTSIREEEFRAMAAPLPIPQPHATYSTAGELLRRESTKRPGSRKGKKIWRGLKSTKQAGSDVSLPFQESIASDMSGSDGREYSVGGLSVWTPRPKLRLAAQEEDVRGTTLVAYSFGAPGRRQTDQGIFGAGTEGRKRRNPPIQEEDEIKMEQFGESIARAQSKRRREQTEEIGKLPKRIDALADDLDAAGLREIMEREHRRKDKKRKADEERVRRRLEKRAAKQRAKSEEATEAGAEDNGVGLGIEGSSARPAGGRGKSRAEREVDVRDSRDQERVDTAISGQNRRDIELEKTEAALTGGPVQPIRTPHDGQSKPGGKQSRPEPASPVPVGVATPESPFTEEPVIETAKEVRYSHASLSAQAGSSLPPSPQHGTFPRSPSKAKKDGDRSETVRQPAPSIPPALDPDMSKGVSNTGSPRSKSPPVDSDAAIVAANTITPPRNSRRSLTKSQSRTPSPPHQRKKLQKRMSPTPSTRSQIPDEPPQIPQLSLYHEDEPVTALPQPTDRLTALPAPLVPTASDDEQAKRGKKRRGSAAGAFLAGVAVMLFKRGRRSKSSRNLKEATAERGFMNESRDRIERHRAEWGLKGHGPPEAAVPSAHHMRSKSETVPPNLSVIGMLPSPPASPVKGQASSPTSTPLPIPMAPLVTTFGNPRDDLRAMSPISGRSGAPVRTMSKFREDLPESRGASRVQSPVPANGSSVSVGTGGRDGRGMPGGSLEALVRTGSKRAWGASGTPTDNPESPTKKLATTAPDAIGNMAIKEKHESGISSVGAKSSSVDADEEDGASGSVGHSRASNPMSRSLASIDSEGSWLSGKLGGRAKQSLSGTARSSGVSGISGKASTHDAHDGGTDDDVDPNQTPKTLQPPFVEYSPGDAPVADPPAHDDAGGEVMKSGLGRQPTLVHRAPHMKSREGLLNEFRRGKMEGEVAEVEEMQLATPEATPQPETRDLQTTAGAHEAVTDDPLSIPTDRPSRSSSPEQGSPTSDTGHPEEPFVVQRARSVDLGKQGLHVRHLSAGSAKLLEIRRAESRRASGASGASGVVEGEPGVEEGR
ncbi:hypothetical protein P152DRAFT_263822 [Eremomyces bilateralis CBS 781.70]|uniref:Uncharacterized protein n=1 Tax=Eremomyces bilateralis CBS 781.70 TaxID=1392243 RepID=A0A6G1G8L4_9PEZI|nr:uncharacterized protein P152DRAFT_263822 [Eremomyces bilateralis CBS 781.70]KAF1814199.1 hypothetical protein P152DRAFT_263822 [Eremomyces bilateralis CBS 781.70]